MCIRDRVIAGCHPGDCHYSTGNYYTRRRFSVFINLLEYMGIEKERFKIDWISAAEANKLDVYKRQLQWNMDRNF